MMIRRYKNLQHQSHHQIHHRIHARNNPYLKGHHDRLIGTAMLAYEMGITPAYIAIGVAAGLCRYIHESEDKSITAKAVLEDVCGLGSGDEITKLIMDMYDMMRLGKSFGEIRRSVDKKVAERLKDVV